MALRWMNLTLEMMDDDFNLIDRWGQMYNTEPKGQFKNGPGPEVLNFINAAIAIRMEALLRHMSLAELQTLRTGPQAEHGHRHQVSVEGQSIPALEAVWAAWSQVLEAARE